MSNTTAAVERRKEQLPTTVEEIHKSILIGTEKLKAHKAAIRAIDKIGRDDKISTPEKAYKPFYAVQEFGTVPWEFLEELIGFYCDKKKPDILDATVNQGRIWGRGKSRYTYIGLDIDPSVKPDVVGDNTNMQFDDESFDIVVYDPPHVGDQGKSKTKFAEKFGTAVKSKHGNLSHTYPPFLAEAARVLRMKGLLLVKLLDYTHCGKFHFATAEFWLAAQSFGFELQGLNVLPRRSVILDTKWKRACHPRQNACTWMTFKKVR